MDAAQLATQQVVTAPDGSAVRLLINGERASLVHCTLPAGGLSKAVMHKTIEEVWYFIEGRGEVWRQQGTEERVVAVTPGTALRIAPGAAFQFRNTGTGDLRFIIASMPPWPGDDEAVEAPAHW